MPVHGHPNPKSTSHSRPAWVLALGAALAAACAPQPNPRPTETPRPQRDVEPLLVARPESTFDGRLRLGAIYPTLGRYALSGAQSLNGTRLAVRDVNAAGGIHGRGIKLLEYRTGSYFVDAGHAATLATTKDGALAILGSNASSLSMAVAERAEAHGVPQVSNVSTAQDLTWNPEEGTNRRFVFRVCTSDVVMGHQLADFAIKDLGARRAAVLYEIGRAYSAKLARSFADHFAQDGRATAEFFYLPFETDFAGPLGEVTGFDPDVLFVPGSFTDATLIAIQAEALEVRATLLGGDGWSNPRLFHHGGPRQPAYYSDHCFLPAAFQERYRREFGKDSAGCRAILAYDAVLAVADALRRLGPLSDAALTNGLARVRNRLREALAVLDFRGETGRIRFDEHGDSQRGVAAIALRPEGAGGYSVLPYRWLGER